MDVRVTQRYHMMNPLGGTRIYPHLVEVQPKARLLAGRWADAMPYGLTFVKSRCTSDWRIEPC